MVIQAKMLTIRDEQLKAFALEADRAFEQKAVAYLEKHLPAVCEEMGEEAVLDSVRVAMAKCDGYGMRTQGETLRYLNLMYWVGFRFDEDAALPWAREILSDPETDSEVKLELLEEAAMRELGE